MLNFLHQNHPFQALQVFNKEFRDLGVAHIDEVSTTLAVKACRGDPKLGSQIHGFGVTSGLDSFLSVNNSLMHMYCKAGLVDRALVVFEDLGSPDIVSWNTFAGLVDRALVVFEDLGSPDIVSWNTLLSGFKDGYEALGFACRMNSLGVGFDAVTYTSALAHCADCEEFLFGVQLQSLVVKNGMQCEGFIANALLTLYSKWGRIVEAERVFDEMDSKDLVSWNAMLSGYSQEGSYGVEALSTFLEMIRLGMKLDHVSFTSAVSACGHARNLALGKQIHSLTIKRGYGTHESICNVLISTYSKSEQIKDAKLVFEGMVNRNVVSWTTMISISEEHAVSLFNDMRVDGVYPNEVTFVGLVHAICENNMVNEGQMVHGLCIKSNFLSELVVANSFITMYAKFESMKDAINVFQEMEHKVIISWNALISGFTQNKMFQEALMTFSTMITDSKPNEYTFGSVLSSIASSEFISLRNGQWCHSYLCKLGLNNDPIVSGALLDMYAKRGSINESCKVFDEIKEKNQVAWTAIISAHSRHGDYESVMNLYEEIKNQSFDPDSITFLSVLTACARKGMVEKGKEVFESMVKHYKIEPTPEHYSCIVDMYGRAGRLKEAEDFLSQHPGQVGLPMLQSLLGSCKVHGNMEMGKRVSETLLKMEPKESGSYVLMSNIFAERGDWEQVGNIRKGMRVKNVQKVVGFSWVDIHNVKGSSHRFSAADTSHPLTSEIYQMAYFLGSESKSVKVDDVIKQVQLL
ncbi:pentatricopeptide repeat-containing protein [Tanacetum coccineum]|uniref:Pentatricopeptide repeat-containing protein n=1 Tax=Tanacetum coccineum TaxID=301880 RepID=A0ABQ5FRB3_9ASTR